MGEVIDPPNQARVPRRETLTSAPPNEENYDLGKQIARGGMGSVIEAEDRKLGRKVALKVMAFDAFSDDSLRRRFVREAKVLAKLAHPNIVPVYDIVWEDGNPQFYTMKLVQGRTLQEVLDGLREGDAGVVQAFPLDHLLTVFRKVCDAMAFAHSQGVVHRDLKPANVMLGEFGEVLVMDWGLAGIEGDDVPVFQLKDSASDREGALDLTMNGIVMGTPRYMSPEQAQGRAEEIDALSDIFSLGGILYAILTLRPPVDGSSVREVLDKISGGKIDPPTTIKAEPSEPGKSVMLAHCPGGHIPRRLSAVTMKALALDRKQRYQTVAALGKDVVAFQTGHATSAEEIGAAGQLILLMNRNKAVTAALAAILLLSVGFIFKLMATAESERRAAESERRTAYSALLAQALNAREDHDLGTARRLLGEIDPALRGFGWRLLAGLCRGDELDSFRLGEGPGAAPQCLAVLPGGERVALISADGRLHVRSLEGEEMSPPRRLPPHSQGGRFKGLTFSPNGRRFSYASGDVLQVLDVESFAILYEEISCQPQLGWLDDDRLLYGFNGSVSPPPFPAAGAWILKFRADNDIVRMPIPQMCAPLAVSQDRRFFVLHRVDIDPSSWRRSLHVFQSDGDLAQVPPPCYEMPGLEYPGKLVLSQTGRFLAMSVGTTLNRTARVLELSSGRVLFDDEFRFPIHGLAIDPEERRLGVAGDDSVVRLYDFTRGRPEDPGTNTYDDEVAIARCQQVDPGGADAPPRDLLTRSAQDGRAQFYLGHEKRVLDLAFGTSGEFMTVGGTIRRWPVGPARPAIRVGYQETGYSVDHPAASPDGLHVLFSASSTAWLCDVGASRSAPRNVTHGVALRHAPLAVLPDGRPVTMDKDSGDIFVWRRAGESMLEDSEIAGQVPFAHNGQVGRGALSKNGKRLIGTLAGRLFNADLEARTIAWSGDLGKSVSAFASHDLSRDGEWIASTVFGPRVTIHRFGEPGKIVALLDGESRDYDTVVRFSEDGSLLYVGNEDGRVRVWETAAWRERPELGWAAHLSAVTAIALSHDRSVIATSGDDTLKLFPAEMQQGSNRRELLSLRIGQAANWIQFARDQIGLDCALLHSVPGGTLEIWEVDGGTFAPSLRPNPNPNPKPKPKPKPNAESSPPLLRDHAAVSLQNGKVLIAGGEHELAEGACVAVSACHLYDPVADHWSTTGSMRGRRTRSHSLTLLPDGRVLASGGRGKGSTLLTSCEIYDPDSGIWSAAAAMANPHSEAGSILLPGGNVLAAGGLDSAGIPTADCELYNPDTDTWSPTGALLTPLSQVTLCLLHDGTVLATGNSSTNNDWLKSERYDPDIGTWRFAGLAQGNSEVASTTTLADGRVLVVAGAQGQEVESSCRLFDPETDSWHAIDALPKPRFQHTTTRLPDGRVLIAGGKVAYSATATATAVAFDPFRSAWSAHQDLAHARFSHTSTLLRDGRILIVGGRDSKGRLCDVEIVVP